MQTNTQLIFRDISNTPDLDGDEDWEMDASRGNGRSVLGIYLGQDILGYIQWSFGWDEEAEEETGIYFLYRAEIREQFRGHGYFKAALEEILTWDNCDMLGLVNVVNGQVEATVASLGIEYYCTEN